MVEPTITVGGKELTDDQVGAVRVAIESASHVKGLQEGERKLYAEIASVDASNDAVGPRESHRDFCCYSAGRRWRNCGSDNRRGCTGGKFGLRCVADHQIQLSDVQNHIERDAPSGWLHTCQVRRHKLPCIHCL